MVDLDDLKAHLNITTDQDDNLLRGKLAAAQFWVASWCVPNFNAASGGVLTVTGDRGQRLDTPAPLDEAVRQLAAHLYVNREAVNVQEGRAIVVPFGVEDLIAPYRVWSFG